MTPSNPHSPCMYSACLQHDQFDFDFHETTFTLPRPQVCAAFDASFFRGEMALTTDLGAALHVH